MLGANLLPRVPDVTIPDDAVVFNLEQVSDSGVWLNESYLGVLRTHEVWDYSETNVASLRARGIERVRQCAIGYAPCLTRIAPAVEEDIDVLFFGSIYGRRIPILDAIEAAGLRVQRLYGVYGAHRDAWIARAKIVLNLHAYPEQVFEIARVSYLLANRRFVISEPSPGTDRVEAVLREGVVFGTADELPELCRRFAADEAARSAVAKRGFELFRAMRQVDLPERLHWRSRGRPLRDRQLPRQQRPMGLDAPVPSRLGSGYDVVVLGDVLEHLTVLEAVAAGCAWRQRSGARLVCCVAEHGACERDRRMPS